MTDNEIEVIVKPIFTKMFNSNFSACEYGIECYRKGMEYQGIKELAIENDNLIKQVKNLEKEIAELEHQLTHRNCLDCSNHHSNIKLFKAKDLLKQWLQTSKASDCDNINIVTDTEQFLNSEVEK